MKKIKRLSAILLTLSILLCSCGPANEKYFNVKYLFGEWKEGTVHDKYAENGTGYTWDTSDDIDESEATPFEWSLSHDTLLQNHELWNGAIVPKVFIVTALDSIRLDCYDMVSGMEHHYTKVDIP